MAAIHSGAISERISIVTGANSGIGKATALGLARIGGTVVLACRNESRAEAAREEIVAATGNENVTVELVDLANLSSIRSFVDDFQRDHDRLDVLVNNAGLFRRNRELSADGFELTFAVNYLGGFALTHWLLDLLEASAPARIVNVSSRAHEGGAIDFESFQGQGPYSGFRAYGQSKLAQVLFTYELARRCAGIRIAVNACHPGVIRTNFAAGEYPPGTGIVRRFFKSPEQGADTPIYLASSPEVEGVTGRYFAKRREAPSSPRSRDMAVAQRLYAVSEDLIRKFA